MLSWKEIVQKYISGHADKIQQVTKPLRDRFQINYFTYHRIDTTGKYTVLLDRPDWAEHYVDEKYFLEDPYLRHPDVYKSGFCLIEQHGSQEYRERILRNGKELFNLDQCVLLIEKSSNFVEFFGFSGNKMECGLDKLYLNHPEILKSFANHFKEQLNLVLLQMNEEAGSLINLKGSDFHRKDPIHPDVATGVLLEYLRDLGKESEITLAGMLSSREKQCIKLLIAGKSAKETAMALGLSHRTVESYFENIKNKLSCSNKQEVLAVGKHFTNLGLL